MGKKIGMISLGCAKNQVNAEQMMYLLQEAGYTLLGRNIKSWWDNNIGLYRLTF